MNELPTYTRCRLCDDPSPLRLSHVFPKFYWDWMKETGDGYFRDPQQPNIRLQDGLKLRMLCQECETRFSTVETAFAGNIFRPLMKNPSSPVPYGSFALRFLVSVLWRNLALDLDAGDFNLQHRSELERVEDEWRQYLLKRSVLPHYGRVHLFITDFALSDSLQFNHYLTRVAEATPIWSDERGLLGYYAKFAKIVICAEVAQFDKASWINTLVDATEGTISPGTMRIRDGAFGNFIINRALQIENRRQAGIAEISASQKQKILQRLERIAPSFANSELSRALMSDHVWEKALAKVGRNQPCPCGSGRKYKRCHGK